MKKGTTNQQLIQTIQKLKMQSTVNGVNIWKQLAKDLERPRRIRRKVNLYHLQKFIRKGETAVVPGKVLGIGDIGNVTVAAWQFSQRAREKIQENGKAISIDTLLLKNPKGNKVRIIG